MDLLGDGEEADGGCADLFAFGAGTVSACAVAGRFALAADVVAATGEVVAG